MESSEKIATLGALAADGIELVVTCSGTYEPARPHPVIGLTPARYLRKWGPDARLCDLEARYGCSRCGAPIVIELVIDKSPTAIRARYGE